MRKMRIFYEEWSLYFENRASATHEMITAPIEHVEIRALATNEVDKNALDSFLSIGFTHHYEIIKHAESIEDRLFFIQKCASEFWKVDTLKYYLKEGRGKLSETSSNFRQVLGDEKFRQKAIASFRDEYNHKAYLINMSGQSYRFKETQKMCEKNRVVV